MELYNRETGKKEVVENPEAAIRSGTHAPKKGAKINMRSQDGKEEFWVTSEELMEAMNAGYQIENDFHRAVREHGEEHDNLPGAIKTFMGQFGDELLMGGPELYLDATQTPLERAKRERVKKVNSLANGLGGVGGVITGIPLGAPLWRGAAKAGQATSKVVAKALGEEVAAQVGKKGLQSAAKDAARGVASKMAGYGVEGGISVAPIAVTEAMLGDPEDAGETVLAGVGIGSLFGAGTSMAGSLFGLGKKTAKKITEWEDLQSGTGNATQKGIQFLSKLIADVPHEVSERTITRLEQVNAAKSIQELTEEIIPIAERRFEEANLLREQVRLHDEKIAEAWNAVKMEIGDRASDVSEHTVQRLVGVMEDSQKLLSKESQVVARELADHPGTFSVDTLKRQVKRLSNSVKQQGKGRDKFAFGDGAEAVVDLLEGKILPKLERHHGEISLEVAYQIRKDIDDMIVWSSNPADFTDVKNRILKKVRGKVADQIGKVAPRYKSHMKVMHEQSDILKDLKQFFQPKGADFSKAREGLKMAFDPKKGRDQMRVLQKADKMARDIWERTGRQGEPPPSFFDEMAGLVESRELKKRISIESTKGGKFRLQEELLPGLTAERAELQRKLDEALAISSKLTHLKRENAQSTIENLKRKSPNLQKENTLKYLDDLEGTDFYERALDSHAAEWWYKDSTRGSRLVNMFGGIGSAVGAVLGAPGGFVSSMAVSGVVGGIGRAAGGVADRYSGQLLKRLVEYENAGGLAFAEQSLKRLADNLDTWEGRIRGLGDASSKRPKRPALTNITYRLLHGDKEPPKDTDPTKQVQELNDKLGPMLNDPELLHDKMEELTIALREGGAPNIASAFQLKSLQALQYLSEITPKPPRPTSPWAKKVKWKPSDMELYRFHTKLEILMDPLAAFEHLEAGTLQKSHVEVLKSIYPGVHRYMQDSILKTAGDVDLPYNKRVQLEMLLDIPMDRSVRAVQYYQQTYTPEGQAVNEAGKGSFSGNFSIGESSMSTQQRLANR